MKINSALFSQKNFETMIQLSADAAILMDTDDRIVLCNTTFKSMFGLASEDVISKAFPPILDPRVLQSLKQNGLPKKTLLTTDAPKQETDAVNRVETYAYKQDGDAIWVDVSLCFLPAENTIFTFLFISEKNQDLTHKDETTSLTDTDDLTGLNNRSEFQRQLEDQNNHPLSLAIIDIDQYKKINQAFGFSVGNEVLQTFATLLKAEFPEAVCLARLRGDEFGILYSGGMGSGFYKKCEGLREKVTELAFLGLDMPVTISVGMAKYVENSHKHLSKADEALLLAKRNGRNRVYMLLK